MLRGGGIFFSLALQPTFGPWPTSMKLSVSLQVTRSWTFGRTPWTAGQLVAGGGIVRPFLISALDRGEWSTSRPCRFTPCGRASDTHSLGGRVGPGASLDAKEKR
jgi:hypothetical protein